MAEKESGALLTIGELADQLGLPTHILRYWETRFPALKPLTRAGNRRYYRSEDVALAHRINELLNVRGYTIKGAEKLLAAEGRQNIPPAAPVPVVEPTTPTPVASNASVISGLQAIRERLNRALVQNQI